MKKILIVIIALMLTLACLFSLAACKKTTEEKEERIGLEKNVSTFHDAVYVGANDDFSLQLVTGESEKLIVIDGEVHGATLRSQQRVFRVVVFLILAHRILHRLTCIVILQFHGNQRQTIQ